MSGLWLGKPREGTEQEVVGLALTIMVARGTIGEEPEDWSDGLVLELRELLNQNAERIPGLYGDPYARDAEWLALTWEQDRYEDWQRAEADRWECPCGRVYGVEPSFKPDRPTLYKLRDDGAFGDLVAHYPSTYGSGGGQEPRCACGLTLWAVMRDMAAGKLAAGQTMLDLGGAP